MKSLVACLAVAALAAGCASSLPPAPPKAAQGEYSYLIAPGDKLAINVWRHPELSVTVPVRPDGRITAPLVEDLNVAGRTSADVSKEITQRLGRFVRDPNVTVTVSDFVGNAGEQVRVVGQAMKPAALPYKRGMTLLDVMIQVGGLTEFAAGNRAVLVRKTEDNKQYAIRLRDLLRGGDVSANVEMMPGDVIIIPESWF